MTDPSTAASSIWLKVIAVASTACAVLLCLVVAGVLLLVVPRFRGVFEDFDTELPWLTIQLIGTPGKIAAGLCVLAAVALVALAILARDKKVEILIGTVIGTLMMFAAAVTVIGVFLPLVKIIQSVS